MKRFHLGDRGFAVIGSAVIIALAIFMGFGAAVIVQRGHLLHQARLTQQRISRNAHEHLTVAVERNADNTRITVTNDGSVHVVFDHLLLKQPDNRVVAVPSDNEFFDNLVGWWRFSEGTGNTAYDYSGNGNDGILYGDPEWVDGWVGDGALRFDGSGDYVRGSLNKTWGGVGAEATLVARISVKKGDSDQIWDDRWRGWTSVASFANHWRPFLGLHYRDRDGDGVPDTYRTFLYYRNRYGGYEIYRKDWENVHHYAGSIEVISSNEAEGKFYREGRFVNGRSITRNDPDAIMNLGGINVANRNVWHGVYFVGTIDDVQIYDRVLLPSEISQLSEYNVLLYPVSLTPLESHTVTYPFQVDNQATVGVYTHLGNIFWED